jgi:two-component system, chemotaxis family, chemotaxis protein CheY
VAKKIVVIDDSQTVRQQVSLVLNQGGFETLEAGDGADGLQLLQKTADAAMVICDVNMPRMNGLEMVEAMQKAGRIVPTVMLTTEGQPQLIERAKKAGVKGWIVKPFKAELLLAAVKKVTGG